MNQMSFDPERAAGAEPGSAVAADRPLSVSQVGELIRETLETGVPAPISVVGEVSNLRRQQHWFFSLKDETSVLGCVAWSSSARTFSFAPDEGDEIVATGHVSYYGPQGRTQLYVRSIRPVGAGALELRFRALCEELRRLGYFDDARKQPMPLLPRRIAVITSAASAAVHDVMATAQQRCPAVGLVLVDTRVQGDGAAEQVAAAIRRVDRDHERLGVDAILVTRGGGSVEDLWAFNERIVADAALACRLPLAAAIGHESDTTVIELVADLRAATPTQATVHLVPDAGQLREQLDHLRHRLATLTRRGLERQRYRLETAARGLAGCTRIRTANEQVRLARLAGRLGEQRPRVVAARLESLARLETRLRSALRFQLERATGRVDALHRNLRSIDPHRVLGRGYSYTTTDGGRVVTSVGDVHPGQTVSTRVQDGSFDSTVSQESDPASQMDLFRPTE